MYEDNDNASDEETGQGDVETYMPILLDEVRDAIRRLPQGKVAEYGKLPAELLELDSVCHRTTVLRLV